MAKVKFSWKGEEVSIQMYRGQVSCLESALIEGKAFELAGAFAWQPSPQGYDYWVARCEEETLLSAEDRLFLIMLLKHSLYLKEE